MLRWLWLSLAVVVVDQLTKALAEYWLIPYRPLPVLPSLNLTLMYNAGAAFSLLADAGGWQRWLFTGFALLVTTALAIWLSRLKNQERLLAISLALTIGGAVGNLIDRLRHGAVVDFIDIYYRVWHWPAFNVADSAITVGIALLLLDTLRGDRREHPTRSRPEA